MSETAAGVHILEVASVAKFKAAVAAGMCKNATHYNRAVTGVTVGFQRGWNKSEVLPDAPSLTCLWGRATSTHTHTPLYCRHALGRGRRDQNLCRCPLQSFQRFRLKFRLQTRLVSLAGLGTTLAAWPLAAGTAPAVLLWTTPAMLPCTFCAFA